MLCKERTRRTMSWLQKKLVPDNIVLLFLYQEEGWRRGWVGQRGGCLCGASWRGTSAAPRSGHGVRHSGTLVWFLCTLILELFALYSLMLESLFRLFKDIKMMVHFKML